ncbi:hypothetical protein [Alishewanella longhuensis]
MSLIISIETKLELDEVIALYQASGIARPTGQRERMQDMSKTCQLNHHCSSTG